MTEEKPSPGRGPGGLGKALIAIAWATTLAVVAVTVPTVMLVLTRSRSWQLEQAVRQLSRGDLSRALPDVDDESLAGVATELEELRRSLSARIREMGGASEEQDRQVGTLRRNVQDLSDTVSRQVAAVEQTA